MLDRIIMASCAVVMLCMIVLLAYQFRPRQPELVDEIYAPLAVPECNDGARLVTDNKDGLSVSTCEPTDVDPNPRPLADY